VGGSALASRGRNGVADLGHCIGCVVEEQRKELGVG
jgi:hypothetical protein